MSAISKKLHDNRKLVLYMILSIAWALFIFSFSLQTGEESSQVSQGIVVSLIDVFLGDGFLYAEELETFIRKLVHFLEYFVLGVLVWLTVKETKYFDGRVKGRVTHLVVAVFICALVVFCDETIQLFSAGRSGQMTDVLLDSVGALCGSVAVNVINKRVMRKN